MPRSVNIGKSRFEGRKQAPLRSFSQSDLNRVRACLDLAVGPEWERALLELRLEMAIYVASVAQQVAALKPAAKRDACAKAAETLELARQVVQSGPKKFLDQATKAGIYSRLKNPGLERELEVLRDAYVSAAAYFQRQTKPRSTEPSEHLAKAAAIALLDRFGRYPTYEAHRKLAVALALAATGAEPPGLSDVCKEVLARFKRLGKSPLQHAD